MTLSYLTVCSGIEAPTQAWHALGWRAVGFSEIEPFPCAVLSARWGASRPWHMPQPDDVPTHDETGQPRPPRQVDKERRTRASAIKAVAHLPQQAEVPNFGDMSRFIEWPDDTAFNVLAGGTPCQSFSVAGLRKGLADPRGNLMLTYGHIAARFRPSWVVWENVPGVLSSAGGSDFGSFLGLLSGRSVTPPPGGWQNSGIVPGIADAYGLAWRVLDAQYLRTCGLPRAVPQRRRRVVVVGYLGDWRRAAAVLFDRESLSGNPPPRRQTGQGPAPTISSRPTGGGGLGTDFDGGLIAQDVAPTIWAGGNKTGGDSPPGTDVDTLESLICTNSGDVGYCLTASAQQSLDAETETLIAVAHSLRGEGFDASEDDTGRGTPLVLIAFHNRQDPDISGQVTHPLGAQDNGMAVAIQERAVSENPEAGPGGSGISTDGCAYTLEDRNKVQAVAFSVKDYGGDAMEDCSPTLRAGTHDGSHQNGGVMPAVALAENSRSEIRLCGGDGQVMSQLTTGGGKPWQGQPTVATPWAVRRLMPVECERLMGMADGYTAIPWRGKPAPDGPRYKALGNSWATTLAEWLGERIQEVDSWP